MSYTQVEAFRGGLQLKRYTLGRPDNGGLGRWGWETMSQCRVSHVLGGWIVSVVALLALSFISGMLRVLVARALLGTSLFVVFSWVEWMLFVAAVFCWGYLAHRLLRSMASPLEALVGVTLASLTLDLLAVLEMTSGRGLAVALTTLVAYTAAGVGAGVWYLSHRASSIGCPTRASS